MDIATLFDLLNKQDWPELIEKGRSYLERDPDRDEVLAIVAYAHLATHDYSEAARLGALAVKVNPGRFLSQYTTGFALVVLRRHEEAVSFLRHAYHINPTSRVALVMAVQSLAVTEGFDAACAEYDLLVKAHERGQAGGLYPVRSVKAWAVEHEFPVLKTGESVMIPFKPPFVWGQPEDTELSFTPSIEPYVIELRNVRIFHNSSLILTPDGVCLNDMMTHPRWGEIVNQTSEEIVLLQGRSNRLLIDFSDFETFYVDEGIHMGGTSSQHFGHWLPDFLPKLQYFQRHSEYASLPLILDHNMPRSHFEHLGRLAGSRSAILLKPKQSAICRRLLVASSPVFLLTHCFNHNFPIQDFPGMCARDLKFVQGGLAPESGRVRGRRIFLGRKNLWARRLLNEAEIGAALESYGFQTIYMENLSAAEQISIFRDAEWIVGPNGSAFNNVIFCSTDVKVILLSQSNLFNWGGYQGAFEELGYRPVFVLGHTEGARNHSSMEISKHEDYWVPVEKIVDALKGLGLE